MKIDVWLCLLLVLHVFLFVFFVFTRSFPILLIALHLTAILSLWFWIAQPVVRYFIATRPYRELGIMVMLFIVAFAIRIFLIDQVTPGMFVDEITIARLSEKLLRSSSFTPFISQAFGHPTPLMYIEGLLLGLLGKNVISIRLTSIIFGSLTVPALYVLLRLLIKNRITSLLVSLIAASSYPLLVISRFGYEMTASLFFQILAYIFLYLLYKKGSLRYYAGLGLILGAGLYTYLSFRTFALLVFIVALYIALHKGVTNRSLFKLTLFVTVFLASITPLLAYSFTDFSSIMTRTNDLSLFNHNLPKREIFLELAGAIGRLRMLFIGSGDPTLLYNPSRIPMFDPLSAIGMTLGLINSFLKKKWLFYISLFFFISPLVNDIFTLERSEQQYHYWGEGHPNTSHISGIIPIVHIWFALFLDQLGYTLSRSRKVITIIIVGLICFINLQGYFGQKTNSFITYLYNFDKNQARMFEIAGFINKYGEKKVLVSPSLNILNLQYFTDNGIDLISFEPKSKEYLLSLILSHKIVVVDAIYDVPVAKYLYAYWLNNPDKFYLKVLKSPDNLANTFIFYK